MSMASIAMSNYQRVGDLTIDMVMFIDILKTNAHKRVSCQVSFAIRKVLKTQHVSHYPLVI